MVLAAILAAMFKMNDQSSGGHEKGKLSPYKTRNELEVYAKDCSLGLGRRNCYIQNVTNVVMVKG